jgi:hypothetical protein
MVTGPFPEPSMTESCELCRHDTLEAIYEPERSTRGLKVYLCRHCGLLQSLPRIDRTERAPAAVSGGADWGNVRYGKGFRTATPLSTALKRHADLSPIFRCSMSVPIGGALPAHFSTQRQPRQSLPSSPTNAWPNPA